MRIRIDMLLEKDIPFSIPAYTVGVDLTDVRMPVMKGLAMVRNRMSFDRKVLYCCKPVDLPKVFIREVLALFGMATISIIQSQLRLLDSVALGKSAGSSLFVTCPVVAHSVPR